MFKPMYLDTPYAKPESSYIPTGTLIPKYNIANSVTFLTDCNIETGVVDKVLTSSTSPYTDFALVTGS